MPNKTQTRLFGTKTKWKNSPLAFTNNSTIFAPELILSYFSTHRPPSTRLGAFLSPETFSRKFFPKFFPIRPRRLFAVFLVRKIMGVKGFFRPQTGGGCPFLHALYISNRHISTPASLGVLHHPTRSKRHRSGQNRAKVNFFLVCLGVFSGFSETERGETLRYF